MNKLAPEDHTLPCAIGIPLVVLTVMIAAQIPLAAVLPYADALPGSFLSMMALVGSMLLGPWCGALAMAAYLLLGMCGLGVFRNMRYAYFTDFADYQAAGFLLALIPAAFVVGTLGRLGRSFLYALIAMLVGHVLILVLGIAISRSLDDIPHYSIRGYSNMIPGGLIKSLLGAAVVAMLSSRRIN